MLTPYKKTRISRMEEYLAKQDQNRPSLRNPADSVTLDAFKDGSIALIQVKQTHLTQLTSRLLGIAPGKRDMKTINASSRVIWLLVLTISGKILVNGKDYPIYYGTKK